MTKHCPYCDHAPLDTWEPLEGCTYLECARCKWTARVSEEEAEATVREAMRHYYNRDPEALERCLRKLVGSA